MISGKPKVVNDNLTRKEFYTNYPPFKYWSDESNHKLTEQEPINIYVHIPFCSQSCAFCYYKKDLLSNYKEIKEYVSFLKEEIKLVSKQLELKNRPVESIYFGGGTPSLLKEKEFTEIVETLKTQHRIDHPEFSIEVDPGSVSRKKVNVYHDMGVNRISMGVQSYDNEIIKLSQRNHTAEKAIQAVDIIKEEDESICLNVDLLSGLAGDTLERFSKSVDTALSLGLDMITVYKMITYSNTLFFDKGVRKNEVELPSHQDEIVFFEAALDKMYEAGYPPTGSTTFSKNNYYHTYIENSFRGKDLVAYGTSAFGKLKSSNYQNSNNLDIYRQKINEQKLPIYRSYQLSAKDQMVRELLLTTKMFSYSKSEFVDKYGIDYYNIIPDTIQQLSEQNLIELNGNSHVLSRRGIIYADYVGQVLASSLKDKLGPDKIGFDY